MIKIYALRDPITGFVRYIGKTHRNELDRLSEHIYDSKRKNGHKENWIKNLQKNNQKPIIEILKLVQEDEWEFWEKFFIKKFNTEQDIKLVNIESGGNGTGRVSEETKKKLSNKNKLKKSIQVFKLNNQLCGTFASISECVRLFFEIDRSFDSKSFKRFHSTISRICAGKNNSYLGYKFIFFYGDIDLNINLKFDKEYSDANKVRKNFLNETIVSEMRNFYLDLKYNQRELSKMYNVNISTVNSLLRNNIYIDKNYNPDLLLIKKELNNQKGEKNNASKYSELDINNIRKLILEGKGVTEISKTLNIPIGTISNIKYKTQWKHVE